MAETDPVKKALITVAVMLGTIMQTLDSTIANVALPHMQGSLNAAQDQISWVVTSYVVAAAIGLSLTSFLSERYGRRRMLVISIVGFTISSVMCGAAQSLGQIVVFRMIQGFCSGWIIPLCQAALMDVYPREKQSQAMAMWGMGVMVGPVIGPTLGGYLTEFYNWRWVFLINLPIGIIATIAYLTLLDETKRAPRHHFDMMGFGFLAVGLCSLQLMLDRGQTLDWFSANEIIVEAFVAVVALYLFVVHILTTPKPFISLTPFKDRNYSLGLGVMFFCGAVPIATMVLLPLLLQSLMGYPVQTAGMLMAPRGFGTMFAMAMMPRAIPLFGPRPLIIGGLLCMAASMWAMSSFTIDTPASMIAWVGLFQGAVMGMIFVPLNSMAFATIEKRFITEAASLYHLMRNMGSSIGVSFVVTLLARNTQVVRSELTEFVNPYSQAMQKYSADFATNPTTGLSILNSEINKQAAMAGYIDDFVIMMILSLVMVPVIFAFKAGRPQPPQAAQMHE